VVWFAFELSLPLQINYQAVKTMARVTAFLKFSRQTEEVFLFYKSVFKTKFKGPPDAFQRRLLVPRTVSAV